MVRTYLRAAFAYGLQAEHSYTKDAGARWGLTSNPIAVIPVAEGVFNPRDRFLSPAEVRTFWLWLETFDVESKFAPALRIMLATGQRSEEILRSTAATYESTRAMLYWPKTKNGLPHSIPVPHQAAAILDGLHANAYGLFFACSTDPTRPPPADGLRFVVQRFLEEHPEVRHFMPRDCRRTWKTLAGDAGLSKEIRDRLQNHAKMSDISAKHYDRFDYLAERRAPRGDGEVGGLSRPGADRGNQRGWRTRVERRVDRPRNGARVRHRRAGAMIDGGRSVNASAVTPRSHSGGFAGAISFARRPQEVQRVGGKKAGSQRGRIAHKAGRRWAPQKPGQQPLYILSDP
jgi:hypothetical protein